MAWLLTVIGSALVFKTVSLMFDKLFSSDSILFDLGLIV